MIASTSNLGAALATVFSELVDGVAVGGAASILNPGDLGLLRSLDRLSAAEASRSVDGGATIAAHAEHLRYGLSLMNRWVRDGGDPFATAQWNEAWKTSAVSAERWDDIRNALGTEAHRWLEALGSSREMSAADLPGILGSIAHLAYHLGAIRQIVAAARGPKEGSSAR